MKSDGFHFLEMACYQFVHCSSGKYVCLPVEDDNRVSASCIAKRLEGEAMFITDERLEVVPKCFPGASDENVERIH